MSKKKIAKKTLCKIHKKNKESYSYHNPTVTTKKELNRTF